MRLNAEELERLHKALLDAFDLAGMRLMLRIKLDRDLEDISVGKNRPGTFLDVVEAAEKGDWIGLLLGGAIGANPNNAALKAIAGSSLAPTVQAMQAADEPSLRFEREIRKRNPNFDLLVWMRKGLELQPAICSIQYDLEDDEIVGTGFLVGPDLVLTNQHVIADLTSEESLNSARVLFDYMFESDTVLNQGSSHRLAKQWLVLSSPPSAVDSQVNPVGLPGAGELDFALIRLARRAAEEPAGSRERAGQVRGWLTLPREVPVLRKGDPMIVLQHPDGEPLKGAMESTSILGYNGNRTRLRHKTNTAGGSSGSPCFDFVWTLVGLHHSGDPNFDEGHKPQWNEAIPIELIAKAIDDAGVSLEG